MAEPSREGSLTWLLTIIFAALVVTFIALAAFRGFAAAAAVLRHFG